jgi:glycosyltransferase involved in cell wall biosynthesis
MNLIINSIPLLSPITGIGRYTYEIAKKLQDKTELDIDYYYGYISKNLFNYSSDYHSLKSLKSILSKNKVLKKIIRKGLSFYTKFHNKTYDLYWEPNFIPLKNIKTKKLITSVHDFSFELYKEYHPKERIEYFENNFYRNIIKSNEIICFSEFIKKEILDRLDFKEEQVHVIYHGIDHDLFRVYDNLSLDIVLPDKFLFCVGSIEPRKNLLGLLKAYSNLSARYKKEYKLVLAGFKGWNNKEIMDLINKNKKYIYYLGYISDIELAKVYNLASLFIYPSFYEGFGLPPLEAMACGTPVITSNVSSLPEVGGDAVIYCNPYDVEDIKNKIEMVLNDENGQKQMIEKGLQRAKQFTWEKAAKEHLRVFEEILDKLRA